MKKFWLGDEYSGLHKGKVEWIIDTFEKGSYSFVDEGYFHYDRYVIFLNEKDATAYRLRWS